MAFFTFTPAQILRTLTNCMNVQSYKALNVLAPNLSVNNKTRHFRGKYPKVKRIKVNYIIPIIVKKIIVKNKIIDLKERN